MIDAAWECIRMNDTLHFVKQKSKQLLKVKFLISTIEIEGLQRNQFFF